jgi:integrase
MEHLREISDRPLRGNDLMAIAAHVLEFQILTAARPGEALNARWSDIRMDDKLWVIPAKSMKERRRHQVPLADATLALLLIAEKRRVNDWVFPGRGLERMNKVGSWRLLLQMIQHSNYVDDEGRPISMHGFRSTFSDWGNTATKYDWQLIEMALAHEIKGSVRGAYFRGDLLEQRRPLMQDWGKLCSTSWQPAEVIPLHRKTGND